MLNSDKMNSVITIAVSSSPTAETPIHTVQVEGYDDEVLDGVEHIGDYGFTSAVPAGAQVIVGCVGGNRDFPIVLSIGHAASRPVDLVEGETAQYSKFGNEVRLNAAGEVVLNSGADFAVKYTELKAAFDQLKADFDGHVAKYNSHTHVTTATVGASPVLGVLSPTTSQGAVSTADMTNSKAEKIRL